MSFRFLMAFGALACCFAVGCSAADDQPATGKGRDSDSAAAVAEAETAAHREDPDDAGETGHQPAGEHGPENGGADGTAHATVGDAGEYHDPYEDALHANAGPMLEAPEEWKSSLAIWTLVVFGLLMAILSKYAWGPIRDALDHRERSIQANIDAAAEQHSKAAALLADHEAKLAGTADEIRQLIDNARKEAETQKAGILAEAQSAAESEKNRALQAIEAAKNGAIRELAERSVDAAVGMAGTIVKRELKSDDHSSLISEALKHFPSKN